MRVKEAIDFLVQEIAFEAQAEGIPLSNLERRMLYFTETGDAIEDPGALNEEFAAQYRTAEYETKISRLVAHAYRRIKRESPAKLELWNGALRVLHEGDHYILVFCKRPNPGKPWGNWTLQILGALAAFGLFLLLLFFFGSRGSLRRGEPAPVERFFPALSPPIQHVLQFLFLLLLFLSFFPKIYSKFVNLRWPQTRPDSPRKRPE